MNTQTAYLLLLAFLLRHLDELPLELWDQVLHEAARVILLVAAIVAEH